MGKSEPVLFSKDYSNDLYAIAEGDLKTAFALITSKSPGRLENILYMIQQSVEKAIKSVLINRQIPFPLIHDIGILIALLPQENYPPGGFNLTALNPYASIRRYEQGAIPIETNEIKGAYEAGKLVLKWAKTDLKRKKP